MQKPSEQATPELEPGLDDAQVLAYLRAHSGFLAQHAELLAPLLSLERESGDRIVDLQRFVAERLKRRTRELEGECQQMVALARLNLKSQARVHRAVLALMGASSFEHLIQVTTIDLPVFLGLDVSALCIEATAAPPPRCETPGVRLIDPGAVDRLLGPARDMLLRQTARGERAIFGAGAALVRSDALLRLKISPATPVGLLALGSRKEGRFHTGQGTELLGFLARAVEFSIRAWLDLPL
ncbi:MAG TPA: DUF484 family protein [Alphaproteobacteria bacterium]|nr:DUF484 family protein [Alphaproteobacteria bacterium]